MNQHMPAGQGHAVTIKRFWGKKSKRCSIQGRGLDETEEVRGGCTKMEGLKEVCKVKGIERMHEVQGMKMEVDGVPNSTMISFSTITCARQSAFGTVEIIGLSPGKESIQGIFSLKTHLGTSNPRKISR